MKFVSVLAGRGQAIATLATTAGLVGTLLLGAGPSTAQEATPAPGGGELPPYVATVTANQQIMTEPGRWAKPGPWRIALLAQGPNNGWGTIFDLTARYAAAQYGDQIKEFLYADSQAKADKQVNDMEDMIEQRPDVIILTPMGKAALAKPVERAVAAGIPVVTCASSVDTDQYTTEVGRNLWRTAYDTADWLARRLNGKGNVVLFHGIAGVDTAETWKAAAHAALSQYPDIKIVAEDYANWSPSDAKRLAQTMLTANPQIDGIWAGGAEMAIGAFDAWIEAGKPIPPTGATNPANGFLRLAKEHNVDFFAAPYPPAMSKVCVDVAIRLLKGEAVPKYIDVADVMPEAAPFGRDKLDAMYQPELNDDFIAPLLVPLEQVKQAGFARS